MTDDNGRLQFAIARLLAARAALDQAIGDLLAGSTSTLPSDAWPPAAFDLGDGSWLTPQQAAYECSVDVRTVYRWCKRGNIAIKPFGTWWIKRERLGRI